MQGLLNPNGQLPPCLGAGGNPTKNTGKPKVGRHLFRWPALVSPQAVLRCRAHRRSACLALGAPGLWTGGRLYLALRLPLPGGASEPQVPRLTWGRARRKGGWYQAWRVARECWLFGPPVALEPEAGAQLSRAPGVRADLCLLCVSEVGDSITGGRVLSCDETGQPTS